MEMTHQAESKAGQVQRARISPRAVQSLYQHFLRPTAEMLCYAIVLILVVVTRLWDLGSRALHHDESLHTYFSWVYEQGNGYVHHPMMHGPALFHLDALTYLLLGSSDWSSRVPAAIFGIVLALSPVLLRGSSFLGRWGALATSALLLISPSVLYFSRFIRHDIFAVTATVILFVAFLRYTDSPARHWLVLALVASAFMLTTHEVTFVSLFILVTFIGFVFAFEVMPILWVTTGLTIGIFGLILLLFEQLGVPELPPIPWENPTQNAVFTFLTRLILHPVTLAAGGLLLLWLAWSWALLSRRKGFGRSWSHWLSEVAPPGSVTRALLIAWHDRRGLTWGFGLGAALFVTLYTSLFTNLAGLLSGTVGAIGYWLGQHGVQRGEQPWFYYLVMMPQYEPIAVLAFPVGCMLVGWQGLRALLRGKDLSPAWRTHLFLTYWGFAMLAILSWAGEKMPWLIIHITVPLCFLAGSLIGLLVTKIEAQWKSWTSRTRRLFLVLTVASLSLLTQWYLAMAWATAGPLVSSSGLPLRAARSELSLRLAWLPLLVTLVLLVVTLVDRHWRHNAAAISLGSLAALALFQIHAGWRLTYREGDVPRDMLVYVQTSPFVVQLTRQLEQFSLELTGGTGLEIWYDSGTSWPMNWYLREFPNRRYFGTTLSNLPEHPPPVILYSLEYLTPATDELLRTQYTSYDYPMRWWYPEDTTYRAFAIAPELKNPARQNLQTNELPPFTLGDVVKSIWRSIVTAREPTQQAKLFRLITMRELPSPIGSYRFRVYIRNDLVSAFGNTQSSQRQFDPVLPAPPVSAR